MGDLLPWPKGSYSGKCAEQRGLVATAIDCMVHEQGVSRWLAVHAGLCSSMLPLDKWALPCRPIAILACKAVCRRAVEPPYLQGYYPQGLALSCLTRLG